MLTNAGGQAGDALVLTKPLGAGTVATALKRGLADEELRERAMAVMTTLNDRAAAQARAAGAHALTDVTGFGLLGHVHELAQASGLAAEIDAAAVPAIEGVLELLADDARWPAARGATAPTPTRSRPGRPASTTPAAGSCCDAMTSGGLLAAVAPKRAAEIDGWVVGGLLAGPAAASASFSTAIVPTARRRRGTSWRFNSCARPTTPS